MYIHSQWNKPFRKKCINTDKRNKRNTILKIENMKKFNLDKQYELYLERVGLKESEMPKSQQVEMKRVFIGACGQMLLLLRDDITELPDKEACKQLHSMLNQVGNFFLNEQNKFN